MARRFVNVDRDTPMLFPPDMRDWVRKDDMVHFVIEAVEQMDLRVARVNERGSGSEQYPPSMMTALLIYCYAHGIFSSRKIETASYRDVAVRYLTGDTHPDHDTIATFRRRNRELFEQCFVQVLAMAGEVGVLQVGTVSIDGTKLAANASKYKSVSYKRCKELLPLLEEKVQELVEQAEQVDGTESDAGDRLPEELARHEKLKAKLARAKAVLEERAKAKAVAERPAYEAKVEARNKRQGSSKGCHIKPPRQQPQPTDQINLTDEDSGLMRASKNSPYIQGYNAQAVVDADGSQLVVGARVSTCASDRNQLTGDLEAIPPQLGKPAAILLDTGYENMDQIGQVEQSGATVYCSMGQEREHHQPRYDFKPPKEKKPVAIKDPRRQAMANVMATETARAIYRKRKQTVEPVFGIIKEVLGFRRFHLRGLPKVETEWQLVCLSYNFKRLFNLINNETAVSIA